jgi:hypothetical protein
MNHSYSFQRVDFQAVAHDVSASDAPDAHPRTSERKRGRSFLRPLGGSDLVGC